MASESSEKPVQSREHPTVEEHAAALSTPAWALAGLRVRERWPVGFRLAQKDYERALERFLQGPTDGRTE